MNDNPAGEMRPMIHRKPPNDTATWSASLRSELRAAARAGPGRQTLASCGRPTHDWRSGAGKRGIPANIVESRFWPYHPPSRYQHRRKRWVLWEGRAADMPAVSIGLPVYNGAKFLEA